MGGKEREHKYIIQCDPQHRMSTKYVHFELQIIPFIVFFGYYVSIKFLLWALTKTLT